MGTLFRKKVEPLAIYDNIKEGMKEVYKKNLLPLEREYNFHEMQSPMLEAPDFDGKPLVMLIGQYSTGKTTFIRYLLENDFPGMRIGPEPTTDSFNIIEHAEEAGKIPGNVLAVDGKKPFKHLQQFGGSFLTRFESSQLNSQVLQYVTLLDTPGVLAGEKQSVNRGYDFTGVMKWFADRADRIILLFDAHKLDISDEFKNAIQAIKKNEDKIRIVLNKADMMTHQQLMRVYGALMWALARILNNPEVCRIYVGSFWNQPLQFPGNRELFEVEQEDLFADIQGLPRFATIRRLNDLIKRAMNAKVHAILISYLKSQMPVLGKESKKKDLLKKLEEVYVKIQDEYNIPAADMPDLETTRAKLRKFDFTKFSSYNKDLINRVDKMLSEEMPRLMSLMPAEERAVKESGKLGIQGGVFDRQELPCGDGAEAGKYEQDWIVNRTKPVYDEIFNSLEQHMGKISGRVAKGEMVKSKLSNHILGKIWRLADTDGDGMLDSDEFALAKHLIQIKLDGYSLPDILPKHLIPPSKRVVEEVKKEPEVLKNGNIKAVSNVETMKQENENTKVVSEGDTSLKTNGNVELESNGDANVLTNGKTEVESNGDSEGVTDEGTELSSNGDNEVLSNGNA